MYEMLLNSYFWIQLPAPMCLRVKVRKDRLPSRIAWSYLSTTLSNSSLVHFEKGSEFLRICDVII